MGDMGKEKFVMRTSALMVTTNCNLKCKYCGAYIPYFKTRPDRSVEEILNDIDKYFEIVDFVNHFAITGGEPLIYKNLPELFEGLLKHIEKIGRVEIVTNGIIVPNERLLNVLEKYGDKFYRVMIDNYGSDKSKNVSEVVEAFSKHNLNTMVRDYCSENMFCGGWVDMGLLERKKRSREVTEETISKCAFLDREFCFLIVNGIMDPCIITVLKELNVEINPNEYIDLYDEKLSVNEKREKIRSIQNAKYLDMCSYCNGLCKDSVRIRPGEQISSAELRKIKEELHNL